MTIVEQHFYQKIKISTGDSVNLMTGGITGIFLSACFGKYLSEFGKSGQSGETLTIHFKGTAIGAYDVMGPDAGKVIVEIDGPVRDTISRFDSYCTYRRMNYFLIDILDSER